MADETKVWLRDHIDTILWLVFAVFAVSAAAIGAITATASQQGKVATRKHGGILTLVLIVAASSYYTIAADLGHAPAYYKHGVVREVYYARYIDWFFTTPLLLLDVLLLSSIPFGTTLCIILADMFMIVYGLLAAYAPGQIKWGYFTFGCAAMIVLVYGLLNDGLKGAYGRSARSGKMYSSLAGYLSLLWIAYPVIWALAEGTNYIPSYMESLLYAICDVLAKAVFGWVVVGYFPIIEEEHQQHVGGNDILSADTTALLSGQTLSGSAEETV